VNLPNSITLARISCVALFLWILSSAGLHTLHASHGQQELLAAAVLVLASLGGAVDGYLARRTHTVTTLGGLLSSLAGQLLISTAYIALVRYAPELLPAWLAVVMVGREFMVTGMCAVAVQERMTLGVRDVGKGKTALQTISVVAVLAAHAWPVWHVGGTALSIRAWPGAAIAEGLLWLTLAVSLLSAGAYFRAFLQEAQQQSRQRRAPLPFPGKRARDSDVRI
jgi:CDP-diacylglycerol--glycerol-3-phosphate 3-phosphatidyltransferase